MRRKILTLQQIYRKGAEELKEAGIREAALDAWLLLSYVTGLDKAAYYGNPDAEAAEETKKRYQACIDRRRRRVPLQHITGEQEFMGYGFLVNEHVLIPRQDTETLVEEALRYLRSGSRILDLCTGSGCILLSLLKIGRERLELKNLAGEGMDISGEALKVAAKNAERLMVRADFFQGDLFEKAGGSYDMIVSNPPYIPTEVIGKLQDEVRLYDPFIALDGKEDGLHFYRRILADSVHYLRPGSHLLFEIGSGQGEAVSALMEKAGYREICVKKDLTGLDRVVDGVYNGE